MFTLVVTLVIKDNVNVCSPKQSDTVCQRRKNVGEGKEDKKSWIDPPEEPTTVTLSQAEIESCMQTYEVGLKTLKMSFRSNLRYI